MPKIFVNGQFYFNLSSKKNVVTCFFGTQCIHTDKTRNDGIYGPNVMALT